MQHSDFRVHCRCDVRRRLPRVLRIFPVALLPGVRGVILSAITGTTDFDRDCDPQVIGLSHRVARPDTVNLKFMMRVVKTPMCKKAFPGSKLKTTPSNRGNSAPRLRCFESVRPE